MDTMTLRAGRTETTVEKWDGDLDPKIDPPTEVITVTSWFDEEGNAVTDAAQIAQIEAGITAQTEQE